ncbi:carboxypeptidase-like regulatory domain-containing protein [Arenibacter sp. 6A1]|uniref:carboxypeptidase-like regulatory domain-containing protein n=1 Tax=Arenibacter sp. 6A1 TaxID=2720391 RepID=UPI00144612FD|nr:carboxypeptidase-like regulatory domain-containing protein [Arenibacter sp. 6A1]NKI25496.1 carboxypeptidase-like regulatory domain-containing protein [Arenibacter sp. 6A1]
MKNIIAFIAIFISNWAVGQISGIVTDDSNGQPIAYVNVWVKNTRVGATTGENGKFVIESAKIGDSMLVSSLGYASTEFSAIRENYVTLTPKVNELDEVVVIPMKNTETFSIISFKKVKKNRKWYNNGHYSLARFIKYEQEYDKTPFLNQISLITLNAKRENVIFRIRLVEIGENGEPSENGLTNNIILESKKGVNEITLELSAEKILIPKNGFFVVVDRLNIEKNKSFNKNAKMDILQPAIGIELSDQEKNTWFGFGGKWIPPSEIKDFLGSNGNIAVNIKLTN